MIIYTFTNGFGMGFSLENSLVKKISLNRLFSSRAKRNIGRILPFGIIWLVSGLVFLIVEPGATGQHADTAIEMNWAIFIFSSLAITIVGLLVGTIELVYLNSKFSRKSFSRKILYKFLFYTALFFIITIITFPIAASMELNTNLWDKRVWQKLYLYLTSYTHFSTDVHLGVTLGISLFYAEISENIGHGILVNFFTGKYHSPKEENRIFMFLDMRSSTTIAEKLGHGKYFELLREYFSDLSDAIIEHSGEIYQYVGDEVIVSWQFKEEQNNTHCLECFLAMQKDLQKKEAWYQQNYGVLPSFKAGIHLGKVTTGEIGVIKKEITFTGDVLNATARIQGLCNNYGVDLLLSDDLVEQLDLRSKYQLQSLGQTELRGKKEKMELYGWK